MVFQERHGHWLQLGLIRSSSVVDLRLMVDFDICKMFQNVIDCRICRSIYFYIGLFVCFIDCRSIYFYMTIFGFVHEMALKDFFEFF